MPQRNCDEGQFFVANTHRRSHPPPLRNLPSAQSSLSSSPPAAPPPQVMEAMKELTGYTKEDGTVVEPLKFNVVATKYSEDKAKDGGNLGWKRREELNGTFAEVAFKLPKGGVRRGRCIDALSYMRSALSCAADLCVWGAFSGGDFCVLVCPHSDDPRAGQDSLRMCAIVFPAQLLLFAYLDPACRLLMPRDHGPDTTANSAARRFVLADHIILVEDRKA